MVVIVSPKQPLTAVELKALVRLFGASIGVVRAASERGEPLCRVEAFGTHWSEERALLVKVCCELRSSAAPFLVRDAESGEALTADDLCTRLLECHRIELEQARQTQLEIGAIASPSDFESSEPDWTASIKEGNTP